MAHSLIENYKKIFRFKPHLTFFTCLFIACISIQWFQTDKNALRIADLRTELNKVKNDYQEQPEQAKSHLYQIEKQASALIVRDTNLANFYHEIGRFYHDNIQDFQAGLSVFQKALSIRKAVLKDSLHESIFRNYLMIGSCHFKSHQLLQASEYFDHALMMTEKVAYNPVLIRLIYGKSVQVYSELNELQQVIELSHKGVSYSNTPEALLRKASFLNELGIAYFRTKNYDKAIKYYSESFYIYQNLQDSHHSAMCLTNLGICYSQNSNFDSAFLKLNSSLRILDTITTKEKHNYKSIADIHIELAHCYLATNKLPEAVSHYTIATDILKKYGYTHNSYLSEAYIGLGDVAQQQQQYTEALAQYHRAVGVLIPEFSKTTPLATPSVNQPVYAPIEAITALTAKGQVLYKLRQSPIYFKAAQKTYILLDSLLMDLKSHYKEDGSKFNLITRAIPIYEQALSLAIEAKDTPSILHYFDRTKALTLRQGLLDNSAKKIAGMPEAVLEKERGLELDIAFWRKKVMETTDSAELSIVRDSLFTAKQRMSRFVEEDLKQTKEYTQYYAFKYSPRIPLSISDIQHRLKDSMAVIEYFVGKDSLYSLAISPQQAVVSKIKLPIGFRDSFNTLRLAFAFDSSQNYDTRKANFERLSPLFYNWLLRDPLSKLNKSGSIKRLRVIPDDVLGYLPFNLLMDKQAERWVPTEKYRPPFLVYQYAISYDYSRELMFDSTLYKTVSKDNMGSFGGFGIRYDDLTLRMMQNVGKPLTVLENSPKEVQSIRAQIGGFAFTDNRQGGISKAFFIKKMQENSIIHLSMHASMSDSDPLSSALIFSKKDTADDNLLTAGELYAYNFNKNHLTVLSACQTAIGTLNRGEGIMSMARAFVFAGCQSLMSTLWSVRDNDMYLLMPEFYKHLDKGEDKDIALQAAQLAYLNQALNQDTNIEPSHWAAPILTGNIDSLQFKKEKDQSWKIWLVLLLLSAIGMWLFIKQRKKETS
jgi:CHAT domain-containing protein